MSSLFPQGYPPLRIPRHLYVSHLMLAGKGDKEVPENQEGVFLNIEFKIHWSRYKTERFRVYFHNRLWLPLD